MIEKDYDEGGFYVCCDFCRYDLQVRTREFLRAVEIIKQTGWLIIKKGDEWLHKCPDCKKQGKK